MRKYFHIAMLFPIIVYAQENEFILYNFGDYSNNPIRYSSELTIEDVEYLINEVAILSVNNITVIFKPAPDRDPNSFQVNTCSEFILIQDLEQCSRGEVFSFELDRRDWNYLGKGSFYRD